jgi:hypothetical protein
MAGGCGPGVQRWRGTDGRRRARGHAPVFQPTTDSMYPTLTNSNSKTLNQSSKSPNTKVVDQLTLLNFRKGRPVKFSTGLEINILKVTDLHGLVKLFSRTLTGFLRV